METPVASPAVFLVPNPGSGRLEVLGSGQPNPFPAPGPSSPVFQKAGGQPTASAGMSFAAMLKNDRSQNSPRAYKKSFSDILSQVQKEGDIDLKAPKVYKGDPAISLTKEDLAILAQPYKFALVGKFSRRYPDYKLIKPALVKMGFKGSFTVGALKTGFILINFVLEEDFNRLWMKPEWQIAGCSMRIFKWTPDFNYQAESSLAAVWISFPNLPVHFFNKRILFSLASLIGKPIKIDEPTADRTRPSKARICVEIDLLKSYGSKLWVECGPGGWMQQSFFFEDLPQYCKTCHRRGHPDSVCRLNLTEMKGKEVLVNDDIIEDKLNKINSRLQKQREEGSSSGLKQSAL